MKICILSIIFLHELGDSKDHMKLMYFMRNRVLLVFNNAFFLQTVCIEGLLSTKFFLDFLYKSIFILNLFRL